MAMTRWWRLLLPLLVLVAWAGGCGTAQARQRDAGTDCLSDGLRGSTVSAALRLEQHKRSTPRLTSDMTVRVPRQWPHARHLTFGENSPQYRHAMRCLLLGDEAPGERSEWRPHDPVVTATDASVTVHYVAYDWITSENPVLVGPWEVIPTGRTWMIYLWPPTLQTIRWKQIEVDLGGLSFNDLVEHASSSTEDRLVWKNKLPEEVQVEVDPPWQRWLPVKLGQSLWATAGIASWWVCASVLIAVAALRTEPAEAAAGGGAARRPAEGEGTQRSTADASDTDAGQDVSFTRTLLEWAGLSAGVALALLLFVPQGRFSPRSHALLCIPAGVALVFAARPWSVGASRPSAGAGPDEPARPAEIRRRQALAVMATTCAVAAVGLLVILAHDVFGLPAGLGAKTTTDFGRTGLVLLGLVTVWLWLAAMAAWAWRFVREGGLFPGRWTSRWDDDPARCVAVVGSLLAAVAVALLACAWWVSERRWERVNWLVGQPDPSAHDASLSHMFSNFFYTDLRWLFAYSWVLTGVALLALLRFRSGPPRAHGRPGHERFALGPSKPDLLLTFSLFAFFVGVRAARFAGAGALYGVWLGLNILALYALLALGRRWSVLSRMGEQFCRVRLASEQDRSELLEKARQYRTANHQMHLLDQGRSAGVTGEQLEEKLGGLHQWVVTAYEGADPPEQISVLDIALAWGPEGHWWSNAVRAARLAFWFGTPATALLVYYEAQDPYGRQQALYSPIGLPEFAADLVLYQLGWTIAGFTLGALWRLLPGRRSQARAWLLTAAYGFPAVLAAALIHIMDTDPRQLLLYAALLLVILTLTSIWMDLATFRRERKYWPSGFALLLSIHQLRGLSVGVTWILAQLVAVVTIFKSLTH
ncbi:hypothetical protein C3492_40450 [Streptomyces sp. Ru62]|uniref:DUF6185 family protein n=1 Tax=Streptomyces sp. Ru62 TaxID=2080745 RepID=UPI000CDD1E95|nr:DUF6185 family protein [Streptomyces sp. Ru62]POX57973.1 hypothetical protein C3492_40450 [Streptomyces sp. Ru62]